VTIALQVKLILWAHGNEANDTADLRQLRQQILVMQKVYDNVVSPANIAKTILDELEGFNLFNLLKHSFWYLAGISVLLFTRFLVLSVRCCMVQRQLLELGDRLHWKHLRNKKGGMWTAEYQRPMRT
jgi:hypothetical protein